MPTRSSSPDGSPSSSRRQYSRRIRLHLQIGWIAGGMGLALLSLAPGETRFLIPAVVLDVGVIVLMIVGVRQIAAISQLDYGAPVVAIQKRLESLRVERIRVTKWTLLLAPFAWTPMSIVFLKDLLDLDVYAAFGGMWLGANILFGLLVLAVGAWIARRLADSVTHASWVQQLSRDIAGHNLTAAMDLLGSLSQFENEESGSAC